LAQGAAPAPTPIVRGLSVNHVALTVSDIPRSFAFYERLFGVTKGWPATDASLVFKDRTATYDSTMVDRLRRRGGANLIGLTIIGVLNSAVGAYYYLRIIVVMYMREAREEIPAAPVSPALGAALAISVAATLYLGLLPGRVLEFASRSAAELLH